MTFEEKMKIVINNYFKTECSVNTSIREAFEKGFRMGAGKAQKKHAYWIPQKKNHEFEEAWMKCSACGYPVSMRTGNTNFCPNCGAKMDARGEE